MGSHKLSSKSQRKGTNGCEAMDDADQDFETDSSTGHEHEGSVRQDVLNPGDEDHSGESENDDASTSSDDYSGPDGEAWVDAGDIESENGSSSSEDEISGEAVGDPKLHANAGWADAMAKILRTSKPKGKKTVVLAKAKKLSHSSASAKPDNVNEDYGFEIDGQIKMEDEDIKPTVESTSKSDMKQMKSKSRRRDSLAEGKVKPSIVHRERERALSKIATKGVVQLFNAVREQQKDITAKLKQANGSVRKEEKVLKSIDKRAFLDVLMGNAVSEKVEDNVRTKPETDVKIEKQENPATWSVLRDNFLTGSNLKDWDKCGEIKLEDDLEEVELH